jgi:hypothetical protein
VPITYLDNVVDVKSIDDGIVFATEIQPVEVSGFAIVFEDDAEGLRRGGAFNDDLAANNDGLFCGELDGHVLLVELISILVADGRSKSMVGEAHPTKC